MRVAVNVTVGVRVGEGVWVALAIKVGVTVGVCVNPSVTSSVAAVGVLAGVRVAVTVRVRVDEGTGVSSETVVEAGSKTGISVGEKIWFATGSPNKAEATVEENRTSASSSHCQPASM